jgi:plastocyanin
MRRLSVLAFSMFALLALSACASSTGGGAAPAATAPTAAPAGSAPAAGGGGCSASTEAGAASVAIENFAFNPADVTAAVGETITWTNSDSAGHTATLDDGACDTGTIGPDASSGLVFDTAGTYTYHCTIHPNMTGSITIQ